MNTNLNQNTNNRIALNSTFMRLSTGEVGIDQVTAKRNAERAARRSELGRGASNGKVSDFSDPFLVNHCH